MSSRADIAVYNNEGKSTLVVEVKNKSGTTAEWAARMRRNIVVHSLLPSARFFLLALPDRFYLWKDKPLPQVEKPTYEIDPLPFLTPYFEEIGVRPENLSSEGFELLMVSWLNELLQASELPETLKQNNEWLVESGLLDAIKHGRVASEATA
jgi:hypothetical protein